jgi:hypothetical protein
MGKKHHIKLKPSKSLRRALNGTNQKGDLLKRLSAIEQRLSKVESALAASQGVQEDVGIFFTDADHSVQQSQQEAYRSWLAHFENQPDSIEPGRTAHEMAALAASKALQ